MNIIDINEESSSDVLGMINKQRQVYFVVIDTKMEQKF